MKNIINILISLLLIFAPLRAYSGDDTGQVHVTAEVGENNIGVPVINSIDSPDNDGEYTGKKRRRK